MIGMYVTLNILIKIVNIEVNILKNCIISWYMCYDHVVAWFTFRNTSKVQMGGLYDSTERLMGLH